MVFIYIYIKKTYRKTHTHIIARGWSDVHSRFIWDMFIWWVLTAVDGANWITHPAAMEHVADEIISPWANDGIHQNWLKSHSALFLGDAGCGFVMDRALDRDSSWKMATARSCLVVSCEVLQPHLTDCWGLASIWSETMCYYKLETVTCSLELRVGDHAI